MINLLRETGATCPHCDHSFNTAHHLFTSSIECPGCHDMFMTPTSRAFSLLKREEITMGRCAEILGIQFVDCRLLFDEWDAYFYPGNLQERWAARWWRLKGRVKCFWLDLFG